MSVSNPTVQVKVPGRSTFDKSFKNILTGKVGDLIPLVSKYVMPGAKGTLKINLSASLPPLASDTFMRADLKAEAFLVPFRLLYGGFESWLTGKFLKLKPSGGTPSNVRAELPYLRVGDGTQAGMTADLAFMGAGSLADYLGLRIDSSNLPNVYQQRFNIFPFLAYHRVWDDWYRNPRVNSPMFGSTVGNSVIGLSQLPFCSFDAMTPFNISNSFDNGQYLHTIHSRNYGADYFTVAQPGAQFGGPQSVTVASNVFTIQALRQANSIQQWSERSSLASPRLQDYVRAHYGADLASGVAQRAILLGSASYPVYSKGVEAQSGVVATNNPFTSVGSQYGRASASGSDFVCRFECNEPSQLLVLVSLVPEANYGSGIDRQFYLLNASGSQVDLPDPLLENTGNDAIYAGELTGQIYGGTTPGPVFGYVPKNTFYKTSRNEVHGLLRAGQSLASFVAQRTFAAGQPPTVSTSFLKINTTDLDNVTAVTSELSNYGFWLDSFVDFKVSEPLVQSAIPSLQDPAYEHGHSVTLNQKTDL